MQSDLVLIETTNPRGRAGGARCSTTQTRWLHSRMRATRSKSDQRLSAHAFCPPIHRRGHSLRHSKGMGSWCTPSVLAQLGG
eukprot:2431847-Prymnesium_polylepis.1